MHVLTCAVFPLLLPDALALVLQSVLSGATWLESGS